MIQLTDQQLTGLGLVLGLAALILAVLALAYAHTARREWEGAAHAWQRAAEGWQERAEAAGGEPHTVPCQLRTSSGTGDHGYCACWCHGGRHGA